MIFAADKNFPKFVHADSLLRNPESNPFPSDFFLLTRFSRPLAKPLCPKPLKSIGPCSLQINNVSSIESVDRSLEKTDRKPKQNRRLPSILKESSRSQLDDKMEQKSILFNKLMSYHHAQNPEINGESEAFLKGLFSKKRRTKGNSQKKATHLKPPEGTLNSISTARNYGAADPQTDPLNAVSLKNFSQGATVQQKLSFLVSSITSLDPVYQKVKQKQTVRHYSTQLTLSEITAFRMATIPNYRDLMTVLRRLAKSLEEYTLTMGYNERAGKILRTLLSKKIEMKALFFNEDGKLFEPLTVGFMEEQCLIREKVLENGRLVTKFRVEPLMISELGVLSQKIEEMNNAKHIEDLRFTKDSLLSQYQKMKEIENDMQWSPKLRNIEKLPTFNFEIMPNIALMKGLDDFERQFGDCDLIDKKNKMIGRVLEEVIGEMKKGVIGNKAGKPEGQQKKSKPEKA